MSVTLGSLRKSSLAETLRMLVNNNQTGYLKLREGEQDGFLAIENGVIVNARIGSTVALHALFQFVGWRDASFEFHERPLPIDLARDLAVYEPQVLIEGVAFKEEELNLLQQAMPPFDSMPRYNSGSSLGSTEATPADLGLLSLADGHRTVHEIAEMVKLSPLEVARALARFRLAGVLDVVKPKKTSAKSVMAATG
jgi:hypothetical protein